MREGWRAKLNAAQREAVEHAGGPLLVVAGAGTGKTWTLACRVAHLVEHGVPPERLLLLTFSRRAARELLARAGTMTGRDVASAAWGGTFHAVANRLLRLFARPLGLRPDFTVLDQGDGADLMDLIRGELALGARQRRFPRKETLATIYSRTVNAGEPLGQVVERRFPWCGTEVEGIREVFRRYVARKRAQNVLDFDDLLLFWRALVRDPGAGERALGLFDHVLVDEYQDTNALQADILAAVAGAPEGRTTRRPGITAVGDDAQAIYGFRAATVRNILDFPATFPGTRTVRLEENYRSTRAILAVSNAVIAHAPERHEKTLWSRRPGDRRPVLLTCLDEVDQAEWVCRTVLRHREEGVDLRRQAVLVRAAHHSAALEVELSRRNIPFVKYGGLRFLESSHVKDALALLRILENPRDEVSWFRILKVLDGVGPATARRAMAAIGVGTEAAEGTQGRLSPVRALIERPPPVPESARRGRGALAETLADCGAEPPPPVASQLERIRTFLTPVFAARYAAADSRVRDLEQLEHLARRASSRGRFLADLTLDPPASTGDLAGPPLLDDDYLVLSTIHSAKGGEWDVVHVVHAADGMIPSDMATGDAEEIEEERRLLYVALTRARNALTVCFPLRYYRRPGGSDDAHHYAQLSRFLPPDVQALFERRTTSAAEEPSMPRPVEAPTAAAGVDAVLDALWG